jgi:hypothetical protein
MVTATREGQERARLTPPRPVKYNLALTPQERDELDRRALDGGYSNVAEFIRRQLIGGESRAVTPPAA